MRTGNLSRPGAAALILTVLILFASGSSQAIQIGKTVIYKGGNMGSVVFSGTAHSEAGYHCMKCHNVYFVPRIGAARITYADHSGRKAYCFACHNGKAAFDAMGNCNLCHRKQAPVR